MKTPDQQMAYANELSRLTAEGTDLVAQLGKAIDHVQAYEDILRKLKQNHQDLAALNNAYRE